MRRVPSFSTLILLLACGAGDDRPSVTEPPANRAPEIPSLSVRVDHDLPLDLPVFASDPDGDSLTVTVTGLPGWLSFDADTRRLQGEPGEAAINTTTTVRITASDGLATAREDGAIQVVLGRSRLRFEGPWISQTPHRFGHDGMPLETPHFRIYSGFSDPAEREALAALLESALTEVTARLGADTLDYEYPPGGRLHVFSDKLQGDGNLGYSSTVNGWAFRDGFITMAWDAPRRTRQGYGRDRYRGLVTHELTHDVEFFLIGRYASIASTDAWFREGIATYMAGLADGGINIFTVNRADAEAWRRSHASLPGAGNPIAIHTFSDFPPGVITGSYYLWFAQGIRYLVEDEGLGLGEAGLRQFYEDVRAGMDFATSFELRTGVSLEVFQAEFWTRLEQIL